MPKVWSYEKGDRVEVVNSVGSKSDEDVEAIIGKKGFIRRLLTTSQYDYAVRIDGDESDTFFFESELSKLNEYIPKIGDLVRLKTTGEEGIVVTVDDEHKQAEMRFNSNPNLYQVYGWNKYEPVENGEVEVEVKPENFSEHLLHTFMSQYKNQDETYTVPKEVLLNLISNVYEQE